ncbi:high affinity cGMP-specific 3, 5 -cyclic phosphodiesterase 9A-like protein, partial [Clarias magur]
MLLFLSHVALLLHFGIKDAACRKTAETDVIKARLGEELTLDCTYNCSSGFIRGSWTWEDIPACGTCFWDKIEKNTSEDMCSVHIQTRNLTREQTLYNYSCFSETIDDPDLPKTLERLISLQIQDETTGPVIPRKIALNVVMKVAIYQNQNEINLIHLNKGLSSHSIQVPVGDKLRLECFSTNQHCEGQWMREDANHTEIITGKPVEWNQITEENEGTYTCQTNKPCTSQNISLVIGVIKIDDFGWIRPLAATALSVAVMLLLLLIYLCYKKRGKNVLDAEDSSAVIYENTRTKQGGTIHKPTVQDCQSDHEVPYADIVISVRGSSIPELTGLHGQTPRDHRL